MAWCKANGADLTDFMSKIPLQGCLSVKFFAWLNRASIINDIDCRTHVGLSLRHQAKTA